MPAPWAFIQGVAAILGIAADGQTAFNQASGSSDISLGSLPNNVHVYVGDAVQIPYDIEFKFKNSRLDPREVILFELRTYLDGVLAGTIMQGLFQDSDSTWHAKGELWIGGTHFDCSNPSKNTLNLTFVASIIDFGARPRAIA